MSNAQSALSDSHGLDHPRWQKNDGNNAQNCSRNGWLHRHQLNANQTCRVDSSADGLRVDVCLGAGKLVDVDVSAALFGLGDDVGVVCYRKTETPCKSVIHGGDRMTANENGVAESISVELASVPVSVHHILFIVSMFEEKDRFNEVPQLKARVLLEQQSCKDDDLFEIYLAESPERAMLVGILTRKGAYWDFSAQDTPLDGGRIETIVKSEKIRECISNYPSAPPCFRRIQAAVMSGKDLAGKDYRVRFWKGMTSDPYYVIAFKGNDKYKSEHKRKTLNPEWRQKAYDLGRVMETEKEMLEIQVFDCDTFSADDFMGVVHVPAGSLYQLGVGTHTYWFELERSKEEKHKNLEVSGDILVKFDIDT